MLILQVDFHVYVVDSVTLSLLPLCQRDDVLYPQAHDPGHLPFAPVFFSRQKVDQIARHIAVTTIINCVICSKLHY